MIAVDSSSLIDWLDGLRRPDTDAIDAALAAGLLRLPPPVLVEVLSFPSLTPAQFRLLSVLKSLPTTDDFWMRAAVTRRTLLSLGRKCKLADCLIAQCCIDADVPLIARDGDYAAFAEHCGLKLAV